MAEVRRDCDSRITCFFVTTDHRYIVCGYNDKTVCILDMKTMTISASACGPKQCTALCVAPLDNEHSAVLVSDKCGEVWAYDFPLLRKKVRVFGHTSTIITDMIPSPDGCNIITADRDEKIRVSSFPSTNCVVSYCLGHTDVVTCLTAFRLCSPTCKESKQYLLSCSWDTTLKLWDYVSGRLVHSVNVSVESRYKSCAREAACTDDAVKKLNRSPATTADQDDVNKIYDSERAGNFPFKIGQCSGSDSDSDFCLVAILSWGAPCVQIFTVVEPPENSTRPLQIERQITIPLMRIPCDLNISYSDVKGSFTLTCLLSANSLSPPDSSSVGDCFLECFEISVTPVPDTSDVSGLKYTNIKSVERLEYPYAVEILKALNCTGDCVYELGVRVSYTIYLWCRRASFGAVQRFRRR